MRTIEKELEGPLKKDKEKRRASAGGSKRKASLDGAGGGKVRSTHPNRYSEQAHRLSQYQCLSKHAASICVETGTCLAYTEKENEMIYARGSRNTIHGLDLVHWSLRCFTTVHITEATSAG